MEFRRLSNFMTTPNETDAEPLIHPQTFTDHIHITGLEYAQR